MFCIFLVLLTLQGFASDTSIIMRNIPYDELFERSGKEKKPVLLYFHYNECGACQTMEKTVFNDTAVAAFYNKNFICYEVNTRVGNGKVINKENYRVRLHPTFLYLDAGRTELNKAVGTCTAAEFIQHGMNALNEKSSLANLRQQYRNGNRSGDFLYSYCYRLRDAYELDSLLVNQYLQSQPDADLSLEKNIRFLYEFAMYRGRTMLASDSREYRFIKANRSLFSTLFDPEQVDARLMFIVQDELYRSMQSGEEAVFEKKLEALKEFDTGREYNFKEMDGRITMSTTGNHLVAKARLDFAAQKKDTDLYSRYLTEFIQLNWDNHDVLNNLAWDIYEKQTDTGILGKALSCAQRSVALKSYYANHDTYAWLLHKLGRDDEAAKEATIAIRLAEEKQEDCSSTKGLLQTIKSGKKE